jgi:putative Holliday junction resolvase
MPSNSSAIVCLDVGERRIGVATAMTAIPIAVEWGFIEVDGQELTAIRRVIDDAHATTVIIGLPRNQQGEETAQSAYVRQFAARLQDSSYDIVFQDESLTSVAAEQQLQAAKKPYQKGDIDARAAALIAQDYLETHYEA